MKLIGYTAVAVSFLVGWVGVALLVRHWMAEVLPGDYGDLYVQYGYGSQRHVLTDWLELPGSVLGLPVGCFLAYLMVAVLKREDAGERAVAQNQLRQPIPGNSLSVLLASSFAPRSGSLSTAG